MEGGPGGAGVSSRIGSAASVFVHSYKFRASSPRETTQGKGCILVSLELSLQLCTQPRPTHSSVTVQQTDWLSAITYHGCVISSSLTLATVSTLPLGTHDKHHSAFSRRSCPSPIPTNPIANFSCMPLCYTLRVPRNGSYPSEHAIVENSKTPGWPKWWLLPVSRRWSNCHDAHHFLLLLGTPQGPYESEEGGNSARHPGSSQGSRVGLH